MAMESTTLTWVSADSGSMLLLPQIFLHEWEGADTPSDNRVVNAMFRVNGKGTPATDFDRASDIRGYIGALNVGAGNGLVIGPEPFSISVWDISATDKMLVCWVYAQSEESIFRALRKVPDGIWDPIDLKFVVPKGALYLFDAIYPGREINKVPESSKSTLNCLPGTYAVATAEYCPNGETSLILHRLKLCSPLNV